MCTRQGLACTADSAMTIERTGAADRCAAAWLINEDATPNFMRTQTPHRVEVIRMIVYSSFTVCKHVLSIADKSVQFTDTKSRQWPQNNRTWRYHSQRTVHQAADVVATAFGQ